MKRVKIMLTAIGVFAIVGGALAFKAKIFGTESYCLRSNSGTNICTTFVKNARFVLGDNFKYRLTTNTVNCTLGTVTCPNLGDFMP